MTVVDFQPPREIAISNIRRKAERARIRRAVWIALMLLSLNAGIWCGIANLQLQFEAAQHAAAARVALAK
jgi:hypothetical protein